MLEYRVILEGLRPREKFEFFDMGSGRRRKVLSLSQTDTNFKPDSFSQLVISPPRPIQFDPASLLLFERRIIAKFILPD